MRNTHRSDIAKLVDCVLGDYDCRQGVVYAAKDHVVKLTRMQRPKKNPRSVNFLLTIGAPNFREREFIRACQKAGEPFPVKKVQLKFFK